MKDKQQSYFVNIGSSSLLVVFLVLCLATFAILTLSSAKSDHSFSERLAAHKKAYYEASAKAEMVVAGTDEILERTAGETDLYGQKNPDSVNDPAGVSPSFGMYLERVEAALGGQQIEGIPVEAQRTADGCTVSFRVPAGTQQELSVVLQITDYREHVNYYEIRVWEIVNTDSQETKQPLHLMPVIE